MRLDAFLLADAVSAAGGKVYIHGGSLTRLRVPALPFPIGQLGVYARLEPDDEREWMKVHQLRVALIGPTGLPNIPPAEFPIDPPAELGPLLEGEQRFLDIALNIAGVTIWREGVHYVELHLDGELLRSTPLPVAVVTPTDGG